MAGEKDDSLDDPSLLEDEDLARDDAAVVVDPHDDVKPADGKKAEVRDDDVEVVIEEETEEEIEARRQREEEAALDQDGRRIEHDDPDAKYSKEVRERIEREARRAREAIARATAAHQARLKAEAASRARQKEALDVTDSALESQIKSTRAQLVKAKEDGKSEDEVKLGEDLERLNRRKDSVAEAKKTLEQEEEEAKRGGDAAQPNPLADSWKARNRWFGDTRFREQTAITALIDRSLSAEGYDKTSPEYFAELDRRVRRRLPEMQRYMQQRRPQGGEQRPASRREPTGGVRRAEGRDGEQPPRKGKITLKQADLDNMRAFGLDPSNKDHLREYALNKR